MGGSIQAYEQINVLSTLKIHSCKLVNMQVLCWNGGTVGIVAISSMTGNNFVAVVFSEVS